MKAGPKAALTAPPLDLRRLPKRGESRAVGFIERYVTVPKGTGEGRRLRLRPWQRRIVHGLLNEPRPRQGLVSMPAGNAKSTLGAALALYGLLGDGVMGAQVPSSPATSDRPASSSAPPAAWSSSTTSCRPRSRSIATTCTCPAPIRSCRPCRPSWPPCRGGTRPWASSTSSTSSPPTCTSPIAARAGKRDRSLLLALSTPPRDGDTESVMWRLVEHGREGSDPSFFFVEFAAPAGCDLDDEAAWHIANPALGDFLHVDALRATRRTMRDTTFRAWRLGQWPGVLDDAWLPDGAWARCTDATRSIPDGADVVLAFDGSFSRDCTVLVAATIDPRPHVELVELWEAPEGRRDWRVPVVAVEDAIRAACSRWRVLEVAADPQRWQRSLEVLDGDGVPVHEFFQTAARMGPATARMYQLVVDGELTHDGDSRLGRHVGNAILREDSRGARLSKETKDSPRRIDAAVAAVMAVHRAAELAGASRPDIYI